MQYNEQTERNEISIQKVRLTVIRPYVEGHTLTEAEANVLNQTLAENFRNNFAGSVKAEIERAAAAGEEVNATALQEELDSYMADYEFGSRRVGAGRTILDPIEREAINIAKGMVRSALKAKNLQATAEQIQTYAEQLLEKKPSILERAATIVAERNALRESVGNDSIDIDSLLG